MYMGTLHISSLSLDISKPCPTALKEKPYARKRFNTFGTVEFDLLDLFTSSMQYLGKQQDLN